MNRSTMRAMTAASPATPLPSALERLPEIVAAAPAGTLAVFLDYDGTLSPIVERPEAAVLPGGTREAIAALARRCPVAVVSGRDLADVRARVGLEALYYAGSHGFDIAGPNGERHEHPEALKAVAMLDAAERELAADLAGIPGALVDRKRFSIALHYRLVGPAKAPEVEAAGERARGRHPGLRRKGGKMVLELQPDVPWDKGRAVQWLLKTMGGEGEARNPRIFALYLGDDVTDEDAFRALAACGAGIVVMDEPRPSAARYALRDPGEVRAFLERLAATL